MQSLLGYLYIDMHLKESWKVTKRKDSKEQGKWTFYALLFAHDAKVQAHANSILNELLEIAIKRVESYRNVWNTDKCVVLRKGRRKAL